VCKYVDLFLRRIVKYIPHVLSRTLLYKYHNKPRNYKIFLINGFGIFLVIFSNTCERAMSGLVVA
jgi:hypothetical protein